MGSPYYYHPGAWHNARMTRLAYREKLLLVSGKGGVGKTVLSAALAQASAAETPTILLSMHGGQYPHPVFDVPLRYEPTEVRPNLWVADIDSLSATREYVRRKVPFSGFYDAFLRSRAFRDFAEAAPGFSELMSLGKIYDLAGSSEVGRIVVDAPATGHLKTLLDVPEATLKAVLVGPVNHNARKIRDLLLDPERTRLLVSTLPEDMALAEAQELVEFGQQRRMNVGPVLINQFVEKRFTDSELTRLRSAQPDPDSGLAAAIAAGLSEAELAERQQRSLAVLEQIPSVRLPRLPDGDEESLVTQLAHELKGKGTNG